MITPTKRRGRGRSEEKTRLMGGKGHSVRIRNASGDAICKEKRLSCRQTASRSTLTIRNIKGKVGAEIDKKKKEEEKKRSSTSSIVIRSPSKNSLAEEPARQKGARGTPEKCIKQP